MKNKSTKVKAVNSELQFDLVELAKKNHQRVKAETVISKLNAGMDISNLDEITLSHASAYYDGGVQSFEMAIRKNKYNHLKAIEKQISKINAEITLFWYAVVFMVVLAFAALERNLWNSENISSLWLIVILAIVATIRTLVLNKEKKALK